MMSQLIREVHPAQHCDINNGTVILVACAIMTGCACIVLIARIYTRGWMTHSTDRDDYTMWAAVALSVAGFLVIIPEVGSGAGRYGSCLSQEELQRSMMLQFITQPIFAWSILLVKVSIVFCLLRFSPSKTFSRFLWALMVFFIITASMYFLAEMLQCRPLSIVWNLTSKDKCFSPFAIRAAAYANNAISLTVDLLLATLPIPMIWNLQVQMHVKVIIGFVMSLGALAAAACAIRIHYLEPSSLTGDALYDSVPWTIWTTVECNVAIIAASIPSIIPLIKKFHAHRKGENTVSSQEENPTALQDIEQGDHETSCTEASTLLKCSAQQDLHIDGDNDVATSDMAPEIRTDKEELSTPDSDCNEDISKMYANASRNISKH